MVVSCTEYIFHGNVKSYAFKKCLNYYYKFLLERKYLLKQYQYRNIRKKQYCTFQRHWGVDIKNGSVIPAFPDHYWQVSAIFFCFTEVHFDPIQDGGVKKSLLVFYSSLSLVNEDRNKGYSLTKFKEFSKCGFGEYSSQHLATSLHIWNWEWVKKKGKKASK